MARRTHVAVFVVAVVLVVSAVPAALGPAAARTPASDQPAEQSSADVACAIADVDASVERALEGPGTGASTATAGFAPADRAPGVAAATAEAFDSTAAGSGGGAGSILLPGALIAAGYSRHDDTSPLENPTRRRIDEEIERSPGIYVSALVDTVDASRSTVRYHLRVLERENHAFGEKIHGKQRYFPAGSDAPAVAAALADDASGSVVEAVSRYGPATVSELAEAIDRSPSTVSYHLSRLEDDGVVDRERRGEAVVTTLSATARAELFPEADASSPGGAVATGDD